ncbi:MAG TPA: TonB-dependent receptor, partial [Caulobacteraceae bacterium]
QEIVVTAYRKNSFSADLVQAGSFRGARRLDTPLTISVMPRELLLTQQAAGLLDALKNTAGVTSAQTALTVYNNLSIRGIAVDNRGNYRLNGSLPIVNLIDLPLEDKDRVEALKGASALYYGFTTPSGIINLTMKRPTVQPMLEVTASGNDYGAAGVHVDAGGTAGMFGARVNVAYGNVAPGIDHTSGPRELFAGAFDFKPTDRLTFSLDAEKMSKRVNEPGVFKFIPPASTVANPYPQIALPPLVDQTINFGPTWAANRAEESNYLGHVNWKITDAWSLTVDGGESHEKRDRVSSTLAPTNYATGEGALSVLMQPDARYTNKNVRAELAGTFYTGPWFLHEVMVGAGDNFRQLFTSDTIAATCPGATPTAARVTCTQNFFDPRPVPQTPLPVRTGVASYIDDRGLYGFDRVKVGDWLELLGGVRKSDYSEFNQTANVYTTQLQPLSYSYGLVLKPRPWASVYGTYIQGLESTPLAPVTAINAGQQLPATESEQREAGIKLEPRKGLLLQAAYFDINRASTFVNGLNLYVQDGRAEYRGVEMSLTGELTRQWSVYVSALFLDAQQVTGAPTAITTKGTVTTVSPTLVGRRIENTPRTTASISSEYHLDVWVAGLSVNGGIYYTGDRAIDPLNRAYAPAYTLVNLGASYRRMLWDHMTTFRINAENVANTRYWATTGQDFLGEGTPTVVKFAITTSF